MGPKKCRFCDQQVLVVTSCSLDPLSTNGRTCSSNKPAVLRSEKIKLLNAVPMFGRQFTTKPFPFDTSSAPAQAGCSSALSCVPTLLMLQGISWLVVAIVCIWFLVLIAGGVIAWRLMSRMNRMVGLGSAAAAAGAPGMGMRPGPPPLAMLMQLAAQEREIDANRSRETDNGRDSGCEVEECSICLEPLNWAVETNCSHRFCLDCFRRQFLRGHNIPPPPAVGDRRPGPALANPGETSWWRRIFMGPWVEVAAARLSPVVCALCRRPADTIVPAFGYGRKVGGDHVSKLNDIADYNNRFVGRSRGLVASIRDAPVLLQRFCRDLTAGRALFLLSHTRLLVVLMASALYTLSPLDLIPEAVFGVLGLADDALVIVVSLLYVSIIYRGIVRTQLENLANRLRWQQ